MTRSEIIDIPLNHTKDMDYDYKTAPPWYLSIFLGIQHFLSMCTSNAMATLILIENLCLNDTAIKSELISTSFFVMGISTFLQTICGCRLPIFHGATFLFLLPLTAMMQLPDIKSCNISENRYIQDHFQNTSIPESVFYLKIRLINGALLVSSVVELILPISGLLGLFTKLISPLSLASVFTVLSLAISEILINMMAKQWGIGIFGTLITIGVCLILAPVPIPVPIWNIKKGWKISRIKIFQFNPIMTSLFTLWGFCGILTAAGALSNIPQGWGYSARTDTKFSAIYNSTIFKIPYPIQWGKPLVTASVIVGISVGIVISIIESIGDYMMTANVCKAPPIPQYAINRGILVEGFGVFLSGLFGSAVGPTSYSGHMGIMKITKAGHCRISQWAAVVMIFCGIFPIFGAIFLCIPEPVIGGVIFTVSLMIMVCAVGYFESIDLQSTRNPFIFGLSVAFGIYFPPWWSKNNYLLLIGRPLIDDIIQILFSVPLFVAATLSILLDNILPGHYYKKGNTEKVCTETEYTELERYFVYDTIFLKWLAHKFPLLQYLPLFPAYRKLENQKKINLTTENILSTHL